VIKLLLLVAIVFAVIWFLRGARLSQRGAAPPKQPPPAAPQDMVECPVCRVHLPRADALPGPDGQLYCCAEHRQGAGG
jgi:uncharacterized protein